MRKLVIDRAAIKNNLTVIKDRAAGAAIYGVVTGDGQGVGAAALAQLLRDEGIGRFAVSEVSEAEALRQAGFVYEEILMLRATTEIYTLSLHDALPISGSRTCAPPSRSPVPVKC